MQTILFKRALVFFALVFFVFLYKFYSPVDYSFFPKCPFLSLTGYKCPGCGSQRALHSILNLDLQSAISHNILTISFIPYLFFGIIIEKMNTQSNKVLFIKKLFFGQKAIYTVLFIIVSFWLLRNILCLNC